MENQIVLLDTSILIDYYRKKDKRKSVLFELSKNYHSFAVSVITRYEIYIGAKIDQIDFWDDFFRNLILFPFDTEASKIAVSIHNDLKNKNRLIEVPDLFIAATAIANNLPCATLNKKHFERILKLKLIES